MWRLQGGSYIPGFTGTSYRAGLYGDVRETREDQAKKGRALKKYMSKRGVMGKWGGRLASGLLGVGLGAMGMGPLGLLAAKSIGAGLGSAFGSSEMLSGKGPSMQPGVGTGLLGSTYERLGEAKGGIGEAMRGQALGAGVAQAVSGLTGMAGDKLGAAFGKTGLGMNLKSGYGKMMAEKFGKNIGQALPEAEQITDLAGTGLARGFDYGESPLNKRFDPSQFGQSQFDPSQFGQSQLIEDYSGDAPRGIWDRLRNMGLMESQQGGYMQGYQQGGMMPGGVSNALPYQQGGQIDYSKTAGLYNRFLAEADSSEIMSGQDINRWRALQNLESSSPEMYDAQSDVGRRFLKDASLTQSLINPKAMEGISQEDRYKLVQGLSPEGRKLYYSQYFDDSEGKQQGGYMPRYNIGGSVDEQPMSYQLGGLLKYRRSTFG
jgi:hypothetical protein